MCGRYTVFTEDEITEMREIIAEVSRVFGENAFTTGEIRPTNIAPVLTLENHRLAPHPVSWGFPKWDGKGVLINARRESALEKSMFSMPLLTRRCVIPSTGFYEWGLLQEPDMQISFFADESKPSKQAQKTKLHFRQPHEPMLYMAGMINTFQDKDGQKRDAFIILTAEANASMMPFHDRMPVILAADEREEWIESDSFMRHVLSREGAALEWTVA